MNKEQKADLRIKAYDLRIKGYSYTMIADEMGISRSTAFRYVTEHLADTETPLADHVRKLEFDRLNRWIERLEQDIDNGDIKAIGTALRISERLAKLTGADMPTKTETTVIEATPLDASIQSLLDEMADRNSEAKRIAAMKGKEVENDEA